MLTVCFAVLMLQTPGPLFQRTELPITGRNGYEELLFALEAIMPSPVNDDIVFLRAVQQRDDLKSMRNPQKRPLEMTPYQARVEMRHYFERLRPLLETAALKGGSRPIPEPSYNTLFPEFSYYRSLGRLAAQQIYVDFSLGRQEDAIKTVKLMLRLNELIITPTLIGGMVASSVEGMMLFALEEFVHMLDVPSANSILALSEERLSQEPYLRRSLHSDFEFIGYMLQREAGQKGFWDALGGSKVQEDVPLNNPSALATLIETTLAELRNQQLRVNQQFLLPESQWGEEQAKPPQGSLPAKLFDLLTPVTSGTLTTAAARRCQWRLVRLAALATLFRWQEGRYPSSLNEFAKPEVSTDPLNGKSFEYTPSPHGFSVRSTGSRYTGPITLRVMREPTPRVDTNLP